MKKAKVTVAVMDRHGMNCCVTSTNALEVVTTLLGSINRTFIVVDVRYCATPKSERDYNEDYLVYVD